MTMKSGKGTLALALVAATCGSASAAIPTVSFAVSGAGASGGSTLSGNAVPGSPGQYQYLGTAVAPQAFFCSVELHATESSSPYRMAFGGLVTLINSSSSTQNYVVDITASTIAQGGSSLIGGSFSGVLTASTSGPATFGAGGGTAGWTGLVNGLGVHSMMTAPQSVTAAAFGTAAIPAQTFGLPIPSMPSGAIGSSMGTRLAFSLSAGAKVDLTSVFVVQVVPAPGALVAFAVALAAPRRRRD
jgi:hypothetical protein